MRNRKFPALIALLVAFAAVTAGTAGANTGTVGDTDETATMTATVAETDLAGDRLIGTVSNVLLESSGTSLDTLLTGQLTVGVVETLAEGVNSWHVSVRVDDLVETLDNTKTIPASNVTMTPTGASILTQELIDLGTLSADTATGGTLEAEKDLFTVTGQDTGTLYTGEYQGQADVELDLGATATTGTYTSKIYVTLYE